MTPLPLGRLIALVGVCLLMVALGLSLGSRQVPLVDVWAYVFGDSSSFNALVVDYRLPRTLTAMLCGAALGLSGALMQGLTRNPLADTGLLGVNAGASASIVTLSLLFDGAVSVVWLAVPGALLAALLVCFIGLRGRSSDHTRLILAGAAIAASLYAYVQAMAQLHPVIFDQYRFWASGTFSGVSLTHVQQILPIFGVASLGALSLAKYINIVSLDAQMAQSLGANIGLIRAAILVAASVLAAVAVTLAGPIGFIGLGAVHMARRLVGHDYRALLPASFLLGAALLLAADVVARVLFAAAEVSSGIVTAVLGASLLYVLVLQQRSQS